MGSEELNERRKIHQEERELMKKQREPQKNPLSLDTLNETRNQNKKQKKMVFQQAVMYGIDVLPTSGSDVMSPDLNILSNKKFNNRKVLNCDDELLKQLYN